jgi:hypothetical protein
MDKQSDLLSNYVAKAVINNSGINISPDAEMESEHSSVCKQTVSDLVDTSETRKRVDVPMQEINILLWTMVCPEWNVHLRLTIDHCLARPV